MTDSPGMPQETDRFAQFPSYTSKEARENLPALVDEVVDSGTPVVIKKLNVGRAAIIPARELWKFEIIERLKLNRSAHTNR